MSVVKTIIGSFGDIGQEVISEAVKVPGDLADSAFESMGATAGRKQGNQKQMQLKHTQGVKTLESVMQTPDDAMKKAIARRALEELAGAGHVRKEPTLWEKKQREEEEKKRLQKEQKKLAEDLNIPKIQTKRKRGDLYGIRTKISSEKQKNVIAE